MKPPGHESEKHKLGLIVCIGIVAGNMIEGIALLPANLASIGSISLIGWIIVVIGAMSLAYVYARLSTVNPQSGGPVAYAGEVSTAFGFQSSILYYNANWVGNLAIGVTAVSYLSMFFLPCRTRFPPVWPASPSSGSLPSSTSWADPLSAAWQPLVLSPCCFRWPAQQSSAGSGLIPKPTPPIGILQAPPIPKRSSAAYCSASGHSSASNRPPYPRVS